MSVLAFFRKSFVLLILLKGYTWLGAQSSEQNLNCLAELLDGAEFGDWDESTDDGITIKYRDVELSDEDETRQVMVEMRIRVDVDSLLAVLKGPECIVKWNDGFRESIMLKDEGNRWIIHSFYDFPFLLPQQDVISEYRLVKEEDRYLIIACPLPDYKEEVEGSSREQHNYNTWNIIPQPNGECLIEFRVVTLSNSSIPRFLKDPFIRRTLRASFENLQSICEED